MLKAGTEEAEYSLAEAAEVWDVSYETARRWVVTEKRIPHRRVRGGISEAGRGLGVRFRVRVRDVLTLKVKLAEEGRYQDYPAAEPEGGQS